MPGPIAAFLAPNTRNTECLDIVAELSYGKAWTAITALPDTVDTELCQCSTVTEDRY